MKVEGGTFVISGGHVMSIPHVRKKAINTNMYRTTELQGLAEHV